MPSSEVTRSIQGKRAIAVRLGRPTTELDREYAESRIADFVQSTLEKLPPLTDDQCARIATLLKGGGAS